MQRENSLKIKKTIQKKVIETEKSFLSLLQFPDLELLEKCVDDVIKGDSLEKRPPITVFGKKTHQPRNVGFFSDEVKSYKYSNRAHASIPMTSNLREMLSTVNSIYESDYNGILVNEYLDGKDKIGAHSDSEIELIKEIGVVALSWGASRKFRIRSKKGKGILKDVVTKSGELMQMGGEFQKEFTHEIPEELTVKEKRISFTFRKHTNFLEK